MQYHSYQGYFPQHTATILYGQSSSMDMQGMIMLVLYIHYNVYSLTYICVTACDGFKCDDGECTTFSTDECDRFSDCDDGSDEDDCGMHY